jgi:peptidoglycan/xylan/chitin deacetylase (PgdA/CDA1 family)
LKNIVASTTLLSLALVAWGLELPVAEAPKAVPSFLEALNLLGERPVTKDFGLMLRESGRPTVQGVSIRPDRRSAPSAGSENPAIPGSLPFALPPNHLVNPSGQNARLVALCFDDGPFNDAKNPHRGTEDLLDILKAYGVKASFFVVGRHIKHFPSSFQRMIDEGHEIDNHTYSHRVLTTMTVSEAIADIRRNAETIAQYYQGPVRFFRAPDWLSSRELASAIKSNFGYKMMSARNDHDVHDWGASCTVGSIYANAVKLETNTNFVLVLHCDGPEIGNKLSLVKILDKYLADGYQFVTLGDFADLGYLK